MTATLKVLDGGVFATFQDMGRMGYQDVGVPVSGALDKTSVRLANVLLGNASEAPVLEMLLQGVTLEVQAEAVRMVLFGCDGVLVVSGKRQITIPAGRSVRLVRGELVKVSTLGQSLCGYLAVEGGFEVPLQLGSASTYVRGGIGGLEGRVLRRGDMLALALDEAPTRMEKELSAPFDYAYTQAIRVVLGPQDDCFKASAIRTFFEVEYVVSDKADRMGFRLDGPPLEHENGYDLISDGIVSGAIQVPGSGQPIALLADAQTTGGYPKIATVISSDIAVLARRRPGARVRFEQVTQAQAEALACDLHRQLCNIAEYGLKDVAPVGVMDLNALRTENLTSGVV